MSDQVCFEKFDSIVNSPLKNYRSGKTMTSTAVKVPIRTISKKGNPAADYEIIVQKDFGLKILAGIKQGQIKDFHFEKNILKYSFGTSSAHDVIYQYNIFRGVPPDQARKFEPIEGVKFNPIDIKVISAEETSFD